MQSTVSCISPFVEVGTPCTASAASSDAAPRCTSQLYCCDISATSSVVASSSCHAKHRARNNGRRRCCLCSGHQVLHNSLGWLQLWNVLTKPSKPPFAYCVLAVISLHRLCMLRFHCWRVLLVLDPVLELHHRLYSLAYTCVYNLPVLDGPCTLTTRQNTHKARYISVSRVSWLLQDLWGKDNKCWNLSARALVAAGEAPEQPACILSSSSRYHRVYLGAPVSRGTWELKYLQSTSLCMPEVRRNL